MVFSKHNAFPLQFCVFEIERQANSQAGDFQIVQHLAKFVIADAINDFCVNDDPLEADQVWNVFTHLDSFVDDVKYPFAAGKRSSVGRILRPKRSPYGFSSSPWPSVFRTSIAQPTMRWTSSLRISSLCPFTIQFLPFGTTNRDEFTRMKSVWKFVTLHTAEVSRKLKDTARGL